MLGAILLNFKVEQIYRNKIINCRYKVYIIEQSFFLIMCRINLYFLFFKSFILRTNIAKLAEKALKLEK